MELVREGNFKMKLVREGSFKMKLFHGVSCFYTQYLPRIVLNDLLFYA